MKRMKKLFAILMTMAMVMGLSITGFAATSVNIVVNNLETGTTVKAVQVIKPDSTKKTGWDFATEEARQAYGKAFGKNNPTDDDCQNIIWALIKYADADNTHVPTGITAATAEEINTALNNINTYTIEPGSNGNIFNVTDAGVYAIKATPVQDSDTVYNPMAAYVGFTYTQGMPTLPDEDVTVNAKKTDVPVVKTTTDKDNATGIGKTVTYNVNTAIPYDVSAWTFTDTISGANFVTVSEGDEVLEEHPDYLGKVPVQVQVGTATPETYYATVDGNTFSLDLLKLTENEADRGKEVVLTYQAVVTDTEVTNEIGYDPDHKSDEVKLYTGTIQFTKYDDKKDNPTKLGGAGFIVSKTENGKTEYAVFEDKGTSKYVLKTWTEDIDEATQVYTNNNSKFSGYGTLTVSGLDKGTGYIFTEKTAPEGYSLNTESKTVSFEEGTVASIFTAEGSMKDTKISELPLPSTGGMGTTIFTIAGCVIMISAAGLFFASRRKAN